MKYLHSAKKNRISPPKKNKFSGIKDLIPGADWFLISLIFGIIAFGLIMLSSASAVESFRRYGGTYVVLWRQFSRGFIPGVILFFFLARADYRKWEKHTVAFFITSLFLLLLVFIPGIGSTYGKGSHSWVNIFGISLQPAEVVKLLLIMSLAGWFSYRGKERNRDFWNGFVPFAIIFGAISLLIILQPDIGTLMALTAIAVSVYFVAGANLLHLTLLALGGLAGLGALLLSAPYRIARLMTFLDPSLDPQGSGYQINQALIAVGSGGWLGLGFGQSRQKFAYLPEVIGDSIFAIISEEIGFIFASFVIVAFLLLAWRGLKIYKTIDDDYGRFIVVGIVAWFVFQAFFNIAAIISLMPLTGIPLPFISYGGTSLAATMAAAGILVGVSRFRKEDQ